MEINSFNIFFIIIVILIILSVVYTIMSGNGECLIYKCVKVVGSANPIVAVIP